jgi:DNA-binding XRE family transcriptional regulator
MPEATDRSIDLENLLDSVEDLCEAGREMLREKATLKAQEKLVGELGKETRELLAVLEVPVPASVAAVVKSQRKRGPGRILMDVEILGIKQARQKLALTQDALGKKVGVSGATICLIEKARQKPSSELWSRICKVLGIAGMGKAS